MSDEFVSRNECLMCQKAAANFREGLMSSIDQMKETISSNKDETGKALASQSLTIQAFNNKLLWLLGLTFGNLLALVIDILRS